MNKTYGVNMADKHLVVGSIEVLGDMSGSGIKTIQQKITAIEQKQAFTPASVDYWSELASDGVITPIEKKTIKQQFEEINSIHSQLEQQAALQDKTSEEVWINYNDTFYALQNYLYTTLKLFDDMTVSSPVADRDLFNEYFSTYYSNQSAAQILLTQGEPGRVRNLTNLNEYGIDGEVAVYRNWFYIYNAKTAKWNAVPNTEFLGALNVEPINCNRNQYFLASESFKASKSVIGINGKAIAILNKIFKAPFNFNKGSIYVWKGNTWKEDSDRNSYRYLVATNDIITQGGEISPNLQDAITSVSGTTGYLGMFASDPENVPFNSYYVYIGENTDTRENGTIYIYKHDGWKALDPNNPDTYSYYMKVLKDCLGSTDVQTGAFSSLFANTLAANTAFITALFTEQLTLLQNGFIQSQGHKPGTGFKIQANGHAEFNDVTLGGGSIAGMTTGGSEDTSIALHSGNWSDPNSANGFGILKNGDAYFNNGKFRGDLVAKSLAVENEITVGENFKLDKNGTLTTKKGNFEDVNVSGIGWFTKLGFLNQKAGNQVSNVKVLNKTNSSTREYFILQIAFTDSTVRLKFESPSISYGGKYTRTKYGVFIQKNRKTGYTWGQQAESITGVETGDPISIQFDTTVNTDDYFYVEVYCETTFNDGSMPSPEPTDVKISLMTETTNLLAGSFFNIIKE